MEDRYIFLETSIYSTYFSPCTSTYPPLYVLCVPEYLCVDIWTPSDSCQAAGGLRPGSGL